MKSLYFVSVIMMAIYFAGCSTSYTVPTAFDRALNVSEKVTKLDADQYEIMLSGVGMHNRAGAIETFHLEASKVFPDKPYVYDYKIDQSRRNDINQELVERNVYNTSYQYGAIAGGTVGLLYIIALNEQHFEVTGIVSRIEPLIVDPKRWIEILIPEDQKFKDTLFEGSGLVIAEKTKEAFSEYFENIALTKAPDKNGYVVVPNIIRWQDRNPMSGQPDAITIEYDILDGKDRTLISRIFIQGIENQFTAKKIFSLIPENESPNLLILEALKEKLAIYLKVI